VAAASRTNRNASNAEVPDMRRVLVFAAMAALIIGSIPSITAAARATRSEDVQLIMSCVIESEEQGTLYLVAGVSAEYGAASVLYWWAPELDPYEQPPTLFSDGGTPAGTVDGASLSGSLPLYLYETGEPAGEGSFSASFVDAGEPLSYRDVSQGSNARSVSEAFIQPLAVTGSVQLPDATYDDLSECQAAREHYTFFGTNPDTRIERSSGIGLSCEWATDDLQVQMYASAGASGFAFGEIFVTDATGNYAGFAEISLDEETFSASWELMSLIQEGEISTAAVGGEIAGSAAAAATLMSTGESGHVFDRSRSQMFKFFYEVFAVSGELTIVTPAGEVSLPMGDNCFANSADSQIRFSSPSGHGGRRLANDQPADAEPIAIGDAVSVPTAGTEAAPEASCTIVSEEAGGEVEIPLGHTAWWSFTGTGGDVTIDTAGSDFDTVLGVYVLQGEELVQVGCVDDVFEDPEATLQARLTVSTEADVTYLIQAGGFGESTGQLELSVQ
jgi:hypothetical protein